MPDYYVCGFPKCKAVFHDVRTHNGMHRCPFGHLTDADRFQGSYEEAREEILKRA